MPKAKTPAKPSKAKAAPPAKQAAAPEIAPAPQAAAPEVKAALPKPAKPQIPGRPDQPNWAQFNKGHNQKMAKGRPFRHQGR